MKAHALILSLCALLSFSCELDEILLLDSCDCEKEEQQGSSSDYITENVVI
ncbi:MAG: hypothetical protein HKN45_01370, partial [Flavobacteriales bacterium]|nr:hypothetical protein [Flavobacteriales bacterium]